MDTPILLQLDRVAVPLALALAAGGLAAVRRQVREALPRVGTRAWLGLGALLAASVAAKLLLVPWGPRPGRLGESWIALANHAPAGVSSSHVSSVQPMLLQLLSYAAPLSFGLEAGLNVALSTASTALVFALALLWSRSPGASLVSALLYAVSPAMLRAGTGTDYHVAGDLCFLAGTVLLFVFAAVPGRATLLAAAGGAALAFLGNTELLPLSLVFAAAAGAVCARKGLRLPDAAAAAVVAALLVSHRVLYYLVDVFQRPAVDKAADTIAALNAAGGAGAMLRGLGGWIASQVPAGLAQLAFGGLLGPVATWLGVWGLVHLARAGQRLTAAFGAAAALACVLVHLGTHEVAGDKAAWSLTLPFALLCAAAAAGLPPLGRLARGPGRWPREVAAAAIAVAVALAVGSAHAGWQFVLEREAGVTERVMLRKAERWLDESAVPVVASPRSWIRYVRPGHAWLEPREGDVLPDLATAPAFRLVLATAWFDPDDKHAETPLERAEAARARLAQAGRAAGPPDCARGGRGEPAVCLVEAGAAGSAAGTASTPGEPPR